MNRILIFTAIVLGISILKVPIVFASESSVKADVQVSVCGNEVVEGGENCEPNQYNPINCSQFNYDKGSIKCDISCSFDFSNCEKNSQTVSNEGTNNSQGIDNKDNTSPIPSSLQPFDQNRNGIIETEEFFRAITTWVNSWKELLTNTNPTSQCDVNNDNACNLSDFSILLYYSR